MIRLGNYVETAELFFQFEEMLNKNLDRRPSHEELACSLGMSPRMCEAIRFRFGKGGIVCMKLVDVASRMGVSTERVRSLISFGLRKVRNQMSIGLGLIQVNKQRGKHGDKG